MQPDPKDGVSGKIVIRGTLKLESPLIIGSGQREDFPSTPVLKDEQGNPYIPATSFAGAMRHFFFRHVKTEAADKEQLRYFWGTDCLVDSGSQKEANIYSSALIVNDLLPMNPENIRLTTRDGIRVGVRHHVAEEEYKFDYEIVERGAEFDCCLELTLREAYSKSIFLESLHTLMDALQHSQIRLGAKTRSGFGRVCLENVKFYEFDFSQKDHVKAWLKREWEGCRRQWNPPAEKRLKKRITNDLQIEAWFQLPHSLHVRTSPGNLEQPDHVQLQSDQEPVIPGTSLKGAIRARASQIVNTFRENADDPLLHLFGRVDEKFGIKQKSRVLIDECIIEEPYAFYEQPRIKMDRFTGGTVRGALLQELPVWFQTQNERKTAVKLTVTVLDAENWEAGLFLLILKDLWLSDLAIGGEKSIGRGVLKGVEATIGRKNNKVKISERKEGELNIEGNPCVLEEWVESFVIRMEQEEQHGNKD